VTKKKKQTTKFRPWNPDDGVIFTEKSKKKIVPDIAISRKIKPFEEPETEIIAPPYTKMTINSWELSPLLAPTADERRISALQIYARRGNVAAQKELIKRFGRMNSDWSAPEPLMSFWQRLIFLFRGYNDN
jgi:hypothetical protein